MSRSSCVYNVPMALDPKTSRTEGLEPVLAMARNRTHIKEAQKYTIGPMPVATFMETFLSITSGDGRDMLSSRNAFSAVPKHAKKPAEVYEPLFNALAKSTARRARCPGFVFDESIGRSKRPRFLGYAKPHICCFTPENLAHVQRADPALRVELGYAELFIQTMADPMFDFFVDPSPDAEGDALRRHDFAQTFSDEKRCKESERAFGLHIAFASEVFARQHRVFLFTVSVAGSMARLFRWDRSGCVVTEAFDIHDHPEIFADFFWRFSKLSDAGRGHDLTIQMASQEDEGLFRSTVKEYVKAQLEVQGDELDKALSFHYQPGHVTAVRVNSQQPSEPGEHAQLFLVSRPVVTPLSLSGRCTRGYWCVNAATGRIGFLKDTWRTILRKDTEGDILHHLNGLGVRNIPALAIDGDVISCTDEVQDDDHTFQDTETDRFVDEPWARRIRGNDVIVSMHRHYRLVTHTVGYPLRSLRGTEELLFATYDVFIAMQDALTKDSRIHRDLSVGNIILVKEPDRAVRRGYLIDWESSDFVDSEGEALHAGRAGTWAFMSIRMLYPGHQDYRHTFEDDMEALLYVVLYCALLYLPHRFLVSNLTDLVDEFFDEVEGRGSSISGGGAKSVNRKIRSYTKRVCFTSQTFRQWLDTVMGYHGPLPEDHARYSGKWTPAHLDAFWSDFLKTHALERDDRTVHELSMVHFYDLDSLPSDLATPPGYPRGLRRRRNIQDEDETSSTASSVAQGTYRRPPAKRSRTGPAPTGGLRRSERIRNQQSRAKAATTAVGGSAHTAKAPARKRNAGSKGRPRQRLRK
ncbi:hypothetical protein C8Q73DRAFT_654273 [Cubamyces lactineus]|nr:hypothetical protein C8Q73DRAFT_654273 [Cubamyces lactineus]